ncbi:MAG: polysaccharide export protein [Candidatus Omnitrophica bacterium]|nr:polysaccharide export protein [Candidatus Omnitrophota bacterium]
MPKTLRRAAFAHGFLAICVVGMSAGRAAEPPPASAVDPQRYRQLGEQLAGEGRYQEAAEVFRQAAILSQQERVESEDATRLSQWHAKQAQAALAARQPLQALAHAERATEFDPRNRLATSLLAKARRLAEENRQRLAKKTQLMAQAAASERDGDLRRALTRLKSAQTADPDDAQVRQAIAKLHTRLTSRKPRIQRAAEFTLLPRRPLVEEYSVSPGDVLEVFVWQQPDLTRDVIVRPDGRLSFPLVGDVDAAGLNLTQLDQIITQRLKAYVRFPDVSLAIKRFGGTKTIVLGEVASPGVYVPAGEGRVLEVVAMAGGFTKDAKKENVMLIRGGLAEPQVAKLNLAKALDRGALEENVALQPDDILFVPKGGIVSTLDFMEEFYPTLSELLVGQSIATNFGTRETSGGITR